MSVTLLWGEDDFRLEKALINLREKTLGNERSPLNYRTLSEPSTMELLEAIQTTPMMFGNLLIEVNARKLFMKTTRPASSDENIGKINDALEHLPPSITVVFVCNIPKGDNKKVDGTFNLVKTIKKFGEVKEFQPFRSYQTKELSEWIRQTAKQKNIDIKNDAVTELLTSVGEDLRRLDSELDKLELLVYPNKTVTKKDVASLGISHENIFNFADVWLSGNKAEALIELNKLLEKEPPLRIMAILNTTIKRWLKLKIESKNNSYDELGKIFGMHPFRAQKEVEKLGARSVEQLAQMQKKLTETEFKIKSGKLEATLAMEMML